MNLLTIYPGNYNVMKYVTYKGSLYSKANERIKGLKALGRPYSITTTEEQVQIDNFLFWKVKALVLMLDTNEAYSGVAMRRYEKDHPFGSYPLEWAETIATARAIGKMGIGIDYAYASIEELGGLNMGEVADRDGGQAPVVEQVDKHTFTTEDMKDQLGIKPPENIVLTHEMVGEIIIGKSEPEPESAPETVPELEPESEPEPEPEPVKSRADILAEKLKAKKEEERLKSQKKKNHWRYQERTQRQQEQQVKLPPDKVDKLFDAIEDLSGGDDDPLDGIPEESEDIPWANPKGSPPDDLDIIDL